MGIVPPVRPRPVMHDQHGRPVYQWEIDQLRRERAEQLVRDERARMEEMGLKAPMERPERPVHVYGQPLSDSEWTLVNSFAGLAHRHGLDAACRSVVRVTEQGMLSRDEARMVLVVLENLFEAQRPPQAIPQNMPAITGLRPLTECSCGRSLLPGMRFCDACGRPVSYTGQTVRLDR